MIDSPRLDGLRELLLRASHTEQLDFPLGDCAGLTRLRALDLNCGRIGEAECVRLARSFHVGELSRLSLEGQMTDAELAPLLQAAWLPRVRVLSLAYNALTDRAAEALARCEALANLRSLDLRANLIGNAGGVALARSPHLGRLARLVLSGGMREQVQAELRERFGNALVFA